MSEKTIVFSPRARHRLAEIADYLYQEHLSKVFVRDYLMQFETWLETVLGQFPESGTLMPEYGCDVRRIVYQQYSFIYRVKDDCVEILTLYRENLP